MYNSFSLTSFVNKRELGRRGSGLEKVLEFRAGVDCDVDSSHGLFPRLP